MALTMPGDGAHTQVIAAIPIAIYPPCLLRNQTVGDIHLSKPENAGQQQGNGIDILVQLERKVVLGIGRNLGAQFEIVAFARIDVNAPVFDDNVQTVDIAAGLKKGLCRRHVRCRRERHRKHVAVAFKTHVRNAGSGSEAVPGNEISMIVGIQNKRCRCLVHVSDRDRDAFRMGQAFRVSRLNGDRVAVGSFVIERGTVPDPNLVAYNLEGTGWVIGDLVGMSISIVFIDCRQRGNNCAGRAVFIDERLLVIVKSRVRVDRQTITVDCAKKIATGVALTAPTADCADADMVAAIPVVVRPTGLLVRQAVGSVHFAERQLVRHQQGEGIGVLVELERKIVFGAWRDFRTKFQIIPVTRIDIDAPIFDDDVQPVHVSAGFKQGLRRCHIVGRRE